MILNLRTFVTHSVWAPTITLSVMLAGVYVATLWHERGSPCPAQSDEAAVLEALAERHLAFFGLSRPADEDPPIRFPSLTHPRSTGDVVTIATILGTNYMGEAFEIVVTNTVIGDLLATNWTGVGIYPTALRGYGSVSRGYHVDALVLPDLGPAGNAAATRGYVDPLQSSAIEGRAYTNMWPILVTSNWWAINISAEGATNRAGPAVETTKYRTPWQHAVIERQIVAYVATNYYADMAKVLSALTITWQSGLSWQRIGWQTSGLVTNQPSEAAAMDALGDLLSANWQVVDPYPLSWQYRAEVTWTVQDDNTLDEDPPVWRAAAGVFFPIYATSIAHLTNTPGVAQFYCQAVPIPEYDPESPWNYVGDYGPAPIDGVAHAFGDPVPFAAAAATNIAPAVYDEIAAWNWTNAWQSVKANPWSHTGNTNAFSFWEEWQGYQLGCGDYAPAVAISWEFATFTNRTLWWGD